MAQENTANLHAQRSEQLMLFEGIVIGIYGNWLVSLIQMMTYTGSLVFLQAALTLISLLSLVALLAIGVFGGRLENHYIVLILTFLHYLPLCAALAIEGLALQDAFFLVIGGILFSMIYMAEYTRAKFVERARRDHSVSA
jgi:hypothetical membrane protein